MNRSSGIFCHLCGSLGGILAVRLIRSLSLKYRDSNTDGIFGRDRSSTRSILDLFPCLHRNQTLVQSKVVVLIEPERPCEYYMKSILNYW